MSEKEDDLGELVDFLAWVKANEPRHFGLFDYAHGYMHQKDSPIDFFWSVLKLCAPDFTSYRGGLFLTEQFHRRRVDEMFDEGQKLGVIEVTMNTIVLDGIFLDQRNATWERVEAIGELLVECWNDRLRRKFPEQGYSAFLTVDESVGDILVAFSGSD